MPNANWQPFQVDILNSKSIFMSINKSRQIGASFILSGDSLFDGLIKGFHTIINVSFNLDEAKEKILYAKQWWDARNTEPWDVPAFNEFDNYGNWLGESPNRIREWPELIKENALELRWSNGFRFISHPCRPPRGKRASVVLDEFAHYLHDNKIYAAAFPMITRGKGTDNRITLASTPLGASGMFWQVHTHVEEYDMFARHDFGWWEIEELCETRARLLCRHAMSIGVAPDECVRIYGTPKLRMIRRNFPDYDSFLQEYCLAFLDAAHAFLTWDLIKSCYPVLYDDMESSLSSREQEERYESDIEEGEKGWRRRYIYVKATGVDECIAAIDELALHVQEGRIRGRLVWAYDVGRDHDRSEICIMELLNEHVYERALLTVGTVSFEMQYSVLNRLLQYLPIKMGMIDKGGIGRELAERFEKRYGVRAEGITFTQDRKEIWAKTLKRSMESKRLTLIPDKDQEQQLHSMQRVPSENKKMKYTISDSWSTLGGGQRVKHHGDKFWVCAMATWLAEMQIGRIEPLPAVARDTTAIEEIRENLSAHRVTVPPAASSVPWTSNQSRSSQASDLVERKLIRR